MARTPEKPETHSSRLYRQLAEKLAMAIAGGKYPVGGRLPGERDLATAFRVSRTTVREAIVTLQNDGAVKVKKGSGVYVIALPTTRILSLPVDVGPFDLTEARILFEGESAALAATQISDREIAGLEDLLAEMEAANRHGHGEDADRKFHQMIADATGNRAIASVVESLWTIRLKSPLCVELFRRSRARGVKPVIAEHRAILNALRNRDAQAARTARQTHLKQVMNYLLDATESEALAAAKAKAVARRNRFAVAAALARH